VDRAQLFVLWVALAMPFTLASAQVQVLPGMPITASGTVSTSYVHSNTTGGLDDLNLGTSWNIDGSYFNPNFLHFQVSPYYDLGREFSETEFVTGGRGIGASLDAFSGSSIPLIINFHRALTSEATYNLPDSPHGVGGTGTSQDLSVNWTLRLRRLPPLQLGYVKNDGDFTILGSDAHGASHGNGYSIGSQYSFRGFLLIASYDSNGLAQTLPNLFTTVPTSTDTKQKNLRFAVSRTLGHLAYFDSSATRSDWTSDASGKLQNRSFDTASANLTAHFTSKLTTSARLNYSSDLIGLRISSLLSGTPPTEAGGPIPVALATDSQFKIVVYTLGANYKVGHGVGLQTSAQQATGSNSSGDTSNTSLVNAHAVYERRLFGGSLNASYGLGLNNSSFTFGNLGTPSTSSAPSARSGSTLGQSGSLVYSHQVGMWGYTGSFQYSQAGVQSILTLNSRTYGGELTVQGRVLGWHLATSAHMSRTQSESSTSSTDQQKNFRIALARGPLSIAANQQFSSGLTIVTATGLRSVLVTDPTAVGNSLDNLITPTVNRSSSFTLSYTPSRRLELSTSWVKAKYQTMLVTGTKGGLNDQFDFAVKYHLRQLDCRAGYRRFLQQVSDVSNAFSSQSIYFQVSRQFRLF
jgi:hypothetical protein